MSNVRNMSFALTTRQIREQTKTVTRRRGWSFLKPGDRVRACVKCMGLKPGERVERLSVLEIVSVRREPLHAIDDDDVWREGFNMPSHEFVAMFCDHMGGDRTQLVTRIEFKYVAEEGE